MNVVTLDLETELIPDDWDRISPLTISCAVAYVSVETEMGPMAGYAAWYAGMSNNPVYENIDDMADAMEAGDVDVQPAMTPEEVEQMFDGLVSLIEDNGSPILIGWNSTGFDFPVIAAAIPHRLDDVNRVAKKSLDPCFQFMQELGFPIGLERIAIDMLGEGKLEGMDGKAAAMWPLTPGKIIRYCMKDCELTAGVVEAIAAERQVRWTAHSGKKNAKPLKGKWYTIGGCMKLPPPNRAWMSDYEGQFDVDAMTAWMKGVET